MAIEAMSYQPGLYLEFHSVRWLQNTLIANICGSLCLQARERVPRECAQSISTKTKGRGQRSKSNPAKQSANSCSDLLDKLLLAL